MKRTISKDEYDRAGYFTKKEIRLLEHIREFDFEYMKRHEKAVKNDLDYIMKELIELDNLQKNKRGF